MEYLPRLHEVPVNVIHTNNSSQIIYQADASNHLAQHALWVC